MSADWYDGMDGDIIVNEREFELTMSHRTWFPKAQLPELLTETQDSDGCVNFVGTIQFYVDGYELTEIVNGVHIKDKPYVAILDGGASGATIWKQGLSKKYKVTGYVDNSYDESGVIHPEKIEVQND